MTGIGGSTFGEAYHHVLERGSGWMGAECVEPLEPVEYDIFSHVGTRIQFGDGRLDAVAGVERLEGAQYASVVVVGVGLGVGGGKDSEAADEVRVKCG